MPTLEQLIKSAYRDLCHGWNGNIDAEAARLKLKQALEIMDKAGDKQCKSEIEKQS